MTDPATAELKRLGHAIRLRRQTLRMSQERAASRAGMHRNYIGALERGETNPTYRTLRRVADGLGIPMSKLLARAEEVERED